MTIVCLDLVCCKLSGPMSSYGIVLWEIVTRKIPFDGMSYEAIKRCVLSGIRPEVPNTEDVVIQVGVVAMRFPGTRDVC